jgi:3-oxoacyl-[acyl-carrier-protein] synthase II
MMDAVVLTGAGACTAYGPAPARWNGPPPGALADVPLDVIPEPARARAARAERVTQLLLAAALPALHDADRLAIEGAPRPAVGAVVGTALGCFLTNAAYQRRLADGGVPAASPRLFAATVSNAAAGELAIAARLGGPSITVTAGAAAGLTALAEAADLVRGGHAEALVAAGVDAHGVALAAFVDAGGLRVLGPLGEGAGALVLESAATARRRGARVRGGLLGWAIGFEPDPDAPTGAALADTVAGALALADVAPGGLARVVAASAQVGIERGLRLALGDVAPPADPVRDALGETLAAHGPLAVQHALATSAPGDVVLVVEACASGHLAAIVVRAEDAR